MSTLKGSLKTKSGDILYPKTSLDKVEGLVEIVPASASSSNKLIVNNELATVAKTGSYTDLKNKPAIPSEITVTYTDVTSSSQVLTNLTKNGNVLNVSKLPLANTHLQAVSPTDKSKLPTSWAVSEYVSARGENLLTNGTFLMQNGYNFSYFSGNGTGDGYRGDDAYYCGGCVQITGSKSPSTDEYIAVDPSQKYELSYWIKCSDPDVTQYDWIGCYDFDKLAITASYIMYQTYTESGVTRGVTTYLTEPLNDGDTVVHLADVSHWKTSGAYNGFIFWDYKNSAGYQYPVEEYSRNMWNALYEFSGIDKTNNTITLKNPWNKGTKTAGTYLSQNSSGGTYKYLNSSYYVDSSSAEALKNNGWINKKGYIQGVGKNNASGKFFGGTAFVKVGYLINYANRSTTKGDKSHAITKLSSLSLALALPRTASDISAAPVYHAVSTTTYGVGTSDTYGHVKIITGDLNGKTHTGGCAASQAHTHSQYLTSTGFTSTDVEITED